MQIPHCTRTRQGGRPVGDSVERSRVQAEEIVSGGEKQFLAMRLVKLELEIFRWGLVVFRFGWCVSEAEGRRICATP